MSADEPRNNSFVVWFDHNGDPCAVYYRDAGTGDMARAVLSTLSGEPKEDPDCCTERTCIPDDTEPPCCEIGARAQRESRGELR